MSDTDVLANLDAFLRSDEYKGLVEPAPPAPSPSIINKLDAAHWLCEYDDCHRDEWSRQYAVEAERREAAKQLVADFGGIGRAICAVRENLPPASAILELTTTIDEAVAYVRGNGGPANYQHDRPENELVVGLAVSPPVPRVARTQTQLCSELGVTPNTIRNWAKRANVPPRGSHGDSYSASECDRLIRWAAEHGLGKGAHACKELLRARPQTRPQDIGKATTR